MQRLRKFFIFHKTLFIAVAFLVLFSFSISRAAALYTPGQTLDPACAPGTTDCTVAISGGSSQWTTTGNDVYYNTGNVGIGTATPGSSTLFSEFTSPAGILHVIGTTPAAVSTSSGTTAIDTLSIGGASGGDTSYGGAVGTAGTGSAIDMFAGTGGSITGTPTVLGFGGPGGNFTMAAGAGGTGTTNGGNGGLIQIQGGPGGAGTSGGAGGNAAVKGGNAQPGNNGNGGNVYIIGGLPGLMSARNGNVMLGVSPSNAVRGYIGIINTNPAYTLDVIDVHGVGTSITNQTASDRTANFSNAGELFDTTSGNLTSYSGYFSSTATRATGSNNLTDIGLYATASGAQNNYAAIFDQGNVGINNTTPIYSLDVGNNTISGVDAQFTNSTGSCTINPTTSSLTCSSDMRLKTNITTLASNTPWSFNSNIAFTNQDVLSEVLALNPVQYNWKTEVAGSPLHPGFIAQEVEQVFPNLVATDPITGLLSLNYTGLIPYTVAAVQEMNMNITNIDDLTKTNNWRTALDNWFADTANGIQNFFSNTITTNNLCVGTTCVTQQQFLQMVQNSGQTPSSSGSSTEQPVSDTMPDSTQSSDTQSPDVTAPQPEIVSDQTPDASQTPPVSPASDQTQTSQ